MQVKIKKLREDAITPTYATDGSACFDLYSTVDCTVRSEARMHPVIDTGIAFEIPEGHVMLVYSRSGHGFKNGVTLANNVGVIDADFRDSVKVKLVGEHLDVKKGNRIAQAMIVPYPKVEFVEVDELSETERGTGGIGSTGN